MSEKDTFIFEDYLDIESAITAMNQGAISGYIYIPANFSEASFVRSILPMDIDSDTLNQSTVQVIIDMFVFNNISCKRLFRRGATGAWHTKFCDLK